MTASYDSVEATKVHWQKLVDMGQTFVDTKDKMNWALADIFLIVRDEGAFGSKRLENFAKAIDYGKSSAYNYASVASFYSDPDIRHEIDGMRTMKFYKAQAVIGYVHNEDYTHEQQATQAMKWLRECNDNAWTVDELREELSAFYGDKPKRPAPVCEGLYMRSQLRTVVEQLPVGKTYRVRITEV